MIANVVVSVLLVGIVVANAFVRGLFDKLVYKMAPFY